MNHLIGSPRLNVQRRSRAARSAHCACAELGGRAEKRAVTAGERGGGVCRRLESPRNAFCRRGKARALRLVEEGGARHLGPAFSMLLPKLSAPLLPAFPSRLCQWDTPIPVDLCSRLPQAAPRHSRLPSTTLDGLSRGFIAQPPLARSPPPSPQRRYELWRDLRITRAHTSRLDYYSQRAQRP